MRDSSAGVNRNLNEISERKVSNMAYEFLKKLYGTPKDGEEPKAMTYEELEAAIDADKDIQVVDLKAGEYVSKEKFDAKNTELKGVRGQLDAANAQIKSFQGKDQDIETVRQQAADWETKYNDETQKLRDQMEDQKRKYVEDMFLSAYKFTSKAARKGVLDELREKKFQIDDKDTLVGAADFMKTLMESEDYKNAFVTEDGGKDGKDDEGKDKPPFFSKGSGSGSETKPNGGGSLFDFGFSRLTQPEGSRK